MPIGKSPIGKAPIGKAPGGRCALLTRNGNTRKKSA